MMVQDKILHKPMLAEERVYASPYTHRARFPSLSPLAGRERERGVPLIVELLPRRILSCARPKDRQDNEVDKYRTFAIL